MATEVKIGKFTLESLTTGMYADSRVIYREYIQNATDAIDEAVKKGLIKKEENRIDVNVNRKNRSISIKDNGTGIQAADAVNYLVDIGDSVKHHQESRGFRGIGRLGGTSYCDRLIFRTSAANEDVGTQIVWDCSKLRELLKPGEYEDYDLQKVVSEVVTTQSYSEIKESHYFEVVLEGVSENFKNLLDVKEISNYLAETAPVPFNHQKFIYASEIVDKLKENGKEHEEYNIFINDDPNPIFKAYKTWFKVKNTKDYIKELEFFHESDSEGNLMFLGWIAQTNWLGQIDKSDQMIRGIRVRKKNILIGNERTLDKLFSESRFNIWCIGEIYVFSNVIPNARRDDFEENEQYWQLEEKLVPIIRSIQKYPREFSKRRNEMKTVDKAKVEVEKIESEIMEGITSGAKKKELFNKVDTLIKKVKKTVRKTKTKLPVEDDGSKQEVVKETGNKEAEKVLKKLRQIENKIINNQKYRIDDLSSAYSKDVKRAIRIVFDTIDTHCSCSNSSDLISNIIAQLNKSVSGKVNENVKGKQESRS